MNVQELYTGMMVAIKKGKWDTTPEKAEILSLQYNRGARHKVKYLTGPHAGETEEVTSRSIIQWTTDMEEASETRDFDRKKRELENDFKKQQQERAKLVAEEVLGYLTLLGLKGEVKSNHYAYRNRDEDSWVLWITNPSQVKNRLREIATQFVQHQP